MANIEERKIELKISYLDNILSGVANDLAGSDIVASSEAYLFSMKKIGFDIFEKVLKGASVDPAEIGVFFGVTFGFFGKEYGLEELGSMLEKEKEYYIQYNTEDRSFLPFVKKYLELEIQINEYYIFEDFSKIKIRTAIELLALFAILAAYTESEQVEEKSENNDNKENPFKNSAVEKEENSSE